MQLSIHLYLDTRKSNGKETAPMKAALSRGGKTALLPIGINVPILQWDKRSQIVIGRSAKEAAINRFLIDRRMKIEDIARELCMSGEASRMTITELKNRIAQQLDPSEESFVGITAWFEDYIQRCKATRTKELYITTLKKIRLFDKAAKRLRFEDVNKAWLSRFDAWLQSTGCVAQNARNIHLRNIRAVFNDAIDNEKTTAYPFRRFSIKPEATVKRAVKVDVLRSLFFYPVESWQQKYIDEIRLIFCLVGINIIDLLSAKPSTDGRVVYKRAKTGRLYSIKIEPEAAEIIEQYAGKEHLVSWGESLKDYRAFTKALNREIKRIGCEADNKPFASVSSYTMRHAWASIASSLDIPNETIAAALGHSYGNSTTAIYIDFDMRKVDEANRRVLDWVFYGKK